MSNIVCISSETPTQNDMLFFDCNVLMYIFYTYGNYDPSLVSPYRSYFGKAVCVGAKIVLPAVELSEFINTYSRQEYNRYMRQNHLKANTYHFKTNYRPSPDYATTVADIRNIVNNQILKVAQRIDDRFTSMNLDHLYDNPGEFDFNDRFYINLAQHYNVKIITHDADFKNCSQSIPILTANQQLLIP